VATSQVRSLPHCLDRSSWRLEAKTTALILLVLALLGLLGWLCLTQASQVSTARYRLWEKEAEKARLQRQNAESLAEIAKMLSVPRLKAKAQGSGYGLAEGLQYLDVPYHLDGGVSRRGLTGVTRPDEGTVVSLEEHGNKPLDVARWWEEVISQLVAWTGAQP
jgi:hypothetical protein